MCFVQKENSLSIAVFLMWIARKRSDFDIIFSQNLKCSQQDNDQCKCFPHLIKQSKILFKVCLFMQLIYDTVSLRQRFDKNFNILHFCMLQNLKRKKSFSLNEQLIIGGACIIHHKVNQSKRALFHLKTDKTDKQVNYRSEDHFDNEKQETKSFKISSSQKTKIKYLKNLRKEALLKQNQHNFSKQKVNKIYSRQKKEFIIVKQFFKQQHQSSENSNYKFKTEKDIKKQRISNTQCVKQKPSKSFQRKILPEITEKYRSFTTTNNSKKQIKKIQFFNSGNTSPKQSMQKPKRLKDLELPLPILQTFQQTKQYKIARNNTTKVQKMQKQLNKQREIQKDEIKQKSLSNSVGVKKLKKQTKSNKDFKISDLPSNFNFSKPQNKQNKQNKEEKQKNNRLKVIREQFSLLVNKTNQIQVSNDDSYFNAYIEKGNNGILVKQLIKKRWWWHFSEQNPKQNVSLPANPSKQNSSNTQPLLNSDRKKVNLFWSEWINKPFAQKLQLASDQFVKLKTVYDQFQFSVPEQQQKFQSVKRITDNQTFSLIKDKISLRNANYFKNHFPKPIQNQKFIQDNYFAEKRQSDSQQHQITQNNGFKFVKNAHQMKIHNHIIGCLQLHSKKLLFKNLSTYFKKKNMDPFEFIPLTFYIQDLSSQNYNDFLCQYEKYNDLLKQGQHQNIWILKPGQNSNRGFGISVHKQKQQIHQELSKRLSSNIQSTENSHPKKNRKSVIVQKYIEKCFLINNRKFDFRCYILITTVNGFLKGYWYGSGYIRTSSEQYDLTDIENKMIHLTNDAVQSKNSSFGKFEDYNKLSFEGFKKYLEKQNVPLSKFQDALKRMKKIAYYLIASVAPKIKRHQYTFEVIISIKKLFGLDFMLDQNLKPYLIEANSNPCLDTKGPILTKIIRNLVDNVIMTAIDPLFPVPKNLANKKKKDQVDKDYFETNMFELIFTDKNSKANNIQYTN